eukprot:c9879_g1_i2.p1 GENE.c9879_g1_i2~~c9879_g1_i2.p1  ORF type:complete len:761 (+),score=165.28 c9879_g1_i2:262-2283(+)
MFNFDANTWTSLQSSPTPLFMASSITYTTGATNIFVFGGETANNNLSNAIITFPLSSPSTGTWKVINPRSGLPAPRKGHAAARLNTIMYIFGGLIIQDAGPQTTSEMWSFDLVNLNWSRVDTNPKPSSRNAHVMLAVTSSILLLHGGINDAMDTLSDVWIFNATTALWVAQSTNPAELPRALACAASISGELVLVGGVVDSLPVSDMQLLDEDKFQWHPVTFNTYPSPRWGASCAVTVSGSTSKIYMYGGNTSPFPPGNNSIAKELWEFMLGDKCSLYSTCDLCVTGVSGCGWCEVSSKCVAGANVCPRGFFPSTCPSCTGKTTCDTCAAEDACVWCESTRSCTSGDAQGPFQGTCSTYYQGSTSCPACNTMASCDQCNKAGCGWCFGNNTCNAGNGGGSYYTYGCTVEGSWFYNTTCPGCSSRTQCDSCTAHAQCGYCLSTSVCLEGDESGSFLVGGCDRGYHHDSPCPDCSSDPNQSSSCRRCTNHTSASTKCGWCDQRSDSVGNPSCIAGDTSGPFGTSCPVDDWFTDYGSCTVCSQKYACETCVLDPDCVWCQQFGGFCMPANSTRQLCDSARMTSAQCSTEPPNWDPNGWNSNNNYQEVAIVMGVISALAVMGLVVAGLWWKRQSKKRLMPDAVSLSLERQTQQQSESQKESYLYKNSIDTASRSLLE